MKRIMLTVALMGALTIQASAYCYVAWAAGSGFFFTGVPGTGFLDNTQNGGVPALAQLIWSADGVADAANDSTLNYVTGDDQWLADYTIPAHSGFLDYGDFTAPTFDDNTPAGHSGGFIYVRIFQDNTPVIGEMYYAGPVVANQNKNSTNAPPDTAQGYQANTDLVNGNALNLTMIPEPGTLGLLSLGIVAIGGRCLRRKQKK